MAIRIVLEKENFKFSCSHFTILGPGRAERLHGHNYYVRVEAEVESLDPELGMAFDFNLLKSLVRGTLARLDEFVLLPERSPYLKIERQSQAVKATLGAKNYVFPAEDVLLLPVVNITSEELARTIAEEIIARLPQALGSFEGGISRLAVAVEETRGQSVVYEVDVSKTERERAEHGQPS